MRRLLPALAAAGLTGLCVLGASGAATRKAWEMYWFHKQLHPGRIHIASGDSLHICNRDPIYNQAFNYSHYRYDRFDSPRIHPGKCWTSPKLVNREPHQIALYVFDEIHSASKTYVYIAPKGNPAGFSVKLSVSDRTPPVGASVTFTAKLNKTVIDTPWVVRIREVETGYVVQACGSQVTLGPTGKVCRGQISWDKAESYTFKAYVERRSNPDHVAASSGTVTVHWGG